MFIKSTLASVNLFKVPIRLKIKEQDFFSSKIGEVLSIAIYAYLLYSLSTSDVFYKDSPKVISQDLENSKSGWYNFTETNFFFGIQVSNMYGIGLPVDSTIFSAMAYYYTYGVNYTTGAQTIVSYEAVHLVPCKNTSVGIIFPTLISTYPNALCLPHLRFQIGGAIGEVSMKALEVALLMCNNATSNNTCKTQSTIDSYFLSKKIAYMVWDNLFATNDYKKPVIPKINTQFFNLDSKISKKQRLNIQKVSISSDDGFVTSSASYIESWKIGDIINDFDLNSQVNLFDITFYSTTKATHVIRSYMKIQEALSNLGGIVNILIFAGLIFLKFIPFNGFDVYLSNHLFSFRNFKGDKSDKKQKKLDVIKINVDNDQRVSVPMTETERFKLTATSQRHGDNLISQKHDPDLLVSSNRNDLDIITEPQTVSKIRKDDIYEGKSSSPMRKEEKSSPTRKEAISSIIKKDEMSSPIKSIELQEIHTKLNPCLGDEHRNSEGYIHSFDNEENDKQEPAKTDRNENDIKKSFKRKVTNIEENSSPRIKTKSFTRSMTRKNTREKTLAENFKNYSKIKEKSDILKIELKDVLTNKNGFVRKMKALKMATSKIKHDLDITNIMQKFQEIDKLKLILFNKEQLMLFNLIAKPEIFLDIDAETASENTPGIVISQNLKNLNERSDQNFMELVLYYNRIKKKEGENDLEGRLIKLIDNDMKQYFEV